MFIKYILAVGFSGVAARIFVAVLWDCPACPL